MAQIQHLGACFVECGVEPRFLPGQAVLRALLVYCQAAGGESASAAGALQNFVRGYGL
jgi:hypothetical protein